MPRGINKVIIIGSLGSDPETKFTQGGTAITKISVATEFKPKDGEAKVSWHRITFFGKTAEIAGEYLKKGSQVYVEGRLDYGKYEKDGVTHYTTDIIADEMQMLGGRDNTNGGTTRSGAPSRERPAQAQADSGFGDAGFDDDSIPF